MIDLLLAFILAAGGLCLLILFAPIHLSLKASKEGNSMEGVYSIVWMGIPLKEGTIFPRAAILGEDEKEDEREEPKKAAKKKKKKQGSGIRDISVKPQTLMEALPALARIVVDLFRSIKVNVSCNLRFGLDDPADTAVLSGCLWSVASAAGIPNADITLVPCFEGQRLEGWFRAEMRARILSLVVAVLSALKEKKTIRLMKEVARSSF